MASEQKSLGDLLLVCMPWKRRRAKSDPPPVLIRAHDQDLASLNVEPAPKTGAPIPLVEINPRLDVDSPKWNDLKLVVKSLQASLDVFPPLQEIVGILLENMRRVQIADENRQEYEKLSTEIITLVETLKSHLPKTKPANVPYSIENVVRALRELMPHIEQQQNRSTTSCIAAANEDTDDLLKCYRRMGALFQQLQMDISLSVWDVVTEGQMEASLHHQEASLQHLNPAHLACYNAGLPMDMSQRGGCTENTRMGVLSRARAWSRGENSKRIYWMNGMAGTGKTTIAYSLCEQLEDNKQLGGSFFCSRSSPECRDVNRIVPTIAYQLARYSNPYRRALCDALNKTPDLARRMISIQFDKLLVEPLAEVKGAIPIDLVVVIDALDECTDTRGMKLVLDLLLRHANDLPVKFFIASRPEPSIVNKVLPRTELSDSILHLHDIEQSLVEEDIRKYLTEALSSIQPSAEVVEQLAAQAGRLFIIAATVVRYILPGDDAVNPQGRLLTMLGVTANPHHRDYREVDKLYSAIIAKALEGELEDSEVIARKLVLWTVLCAREPLDSLTLAEVLGISVDQVEFATKPLRSVLHVSAKTGVISVFHASFPDFLLDAERAGRFQCDRVAHHSLLAERCFNLMAQQLRFNICGLENSHRLDKDVPRIKDRVEQAISSGLFYACRYWGDHLSKASTTDNAIESLNQFLRYRLMFWMEVLNLKGWMEHGEGAFTQVLGWIPVSEYALQWRNKTESIQKNDQSAEVRRFAYDARNFVTTFMASGASLSTPHLYMSTLPVISKQSLVWLTYWSRARGLLRVKGSAIETGSRALATWAAGSGVYALVQSTDGKRLVSGLSDGSISIWDVPRGARISVQLSGHQQGVQSVAVSADGSRIASGSFDCTIVLHNANNGAPLTSPLHGHEKCVCGLAFSPDGSRLVSGSEDHTIRLWDAYNGASLHGSFEGHEACVMSVVFSPDGKRIASGSDDRTIRIWDPNTGMAVGEPFLGHSDWVDCVAFSPDGLRLVSSSADKTVRVWNSQTGEIIAGPFEGHTDRVGWATFSPDGQRIVSGSYDRAIRMWNSHSGELIAGPFEGHRDRVSAVLFSIDGTRVISSSGDGTICVWDAQHGTAAAPKSSGHTDSILSVAFSPDGTRAVSGSGDRTVCIWDAHDGALLSPAFLGHTAPIDTVAFSPDGARVASGSRDHTIRTWDAYTGALLAGPFEGHTDVVRSVAFSPDGNHIVSGSHDFTLRLWDSHAGTSVGEPLMGHTHWAISAVFSTDGTRVVSGSGDRTVRMWDAHSSASPLWRNTAHTRAAVCVAFSPDGTRVASGSEDCTILVLNALDGTVLHGPFMGHVDSIWSVGFSPDGSRIVSSSRDCTVCIWDVQSGKLAIEPLMGHTKEVNSVAFSPDGAQIVSGSTDCTIRFWDVASVEKPLGAALRFGRPSNDEGWLTDSESQLLLWLPSDLRQHFPLPRDPMVISSRGALKADYSDLLLGERWHECYVDSNDSD